MENFAELKIDGSVYRLPIVIGSENEKAVDISNLRKESGFITLDSGYQNTGACKSAITFIDGEKGILNYRGYPVDELSEKSTFIETAYLLVYGKLPGKSELSRFSALLTENSLIHEDMLHFFEGYPSKAHPMAILSSMVSSLSVYYPDAFHLFEDEPDNDINVPRLLSKIRTIAAFSYKKSIGEPVVYPKREYSYCTNILNMMFSSYTRDYQVDPFNVKVLEKLLITHADHEQNCSTSTVRLVGSSKVNLYASICAGICALWGPLHGGANQKVMEMLDKIVEEGHSIDFYVDKAKDKNSNFRLMGFGHRIYKTYDPRSKVLKKTCHEMVDKYGVHSKRLEIALKLEERALTDSYFIERNLYPNVDFYSGLIFRMLGIPTNMFPVMFAIGRLPGWIAQWREMHTGIPFKIGRPRQIYIGENVRHYIPIEERI
ncbi:citrate synthase [Candidatus Dependentiae bacterium]|nr:citrate synthase [Candidatus Dependentiae bacterium]